jgi:hypothetical protein
MMKNRDRCFRGYSLVLLFAVGCAPDQYVSMGSDIGGKSISHPGSLGGGPADGDASLTVAAGGEGETRIDSTSGAGTGGLGTVDATSGAAGNANGGFGGNSSKTSVQLVKKLVVL